jgi:DNA-binding transcriptional regulator YiaG
MPNLAKTLKEEISRIARHEAKLAVTPIRKPTIRLRRDVAELKARLASLEKANKELSALVAKIQGAQPEPAPEAADKGWISGKGIKSLRKRLGLSQAEFAKLVGVSDQGVYQWESKSGMLKLRNATKAAVFAVRGIGAREAKQRLEQMGKKPVKAPGRPKAKTGKKVG